jgi:hypothetical protein
MFQSINKKLIINYQLNKQLVIEYGDYEEQKKFAFLNFEWYKTSYIQIKMIPLWLVYFYIAFLIELPPFIAVVLPFVILFIFYFAAINLTNYYKLEITPQKVIEKDLKRTKEYIFPDKIIIEVDGLEKDRLLGFWIDENFDFCFDDELEQPQKKVILDYLVELLNLEFVATETKQSDKSTWEISTYQSKNNK